ncbi:hypothetical protein JX266_012670 [Neoarthrinium moseri]|nr:hypothetical protein JX266_012670 [Neoarthrinium moseri]
MAQMQKSMVAAFSARHGATVEASSNVSFPARVLALSTAFVSSRYYKSAAFERPFHFSILTLLLTGTALYLWSRFVLRQSTSYEPIRAANGYAGKHAPEGPNRLRRTLRLLLSTPLSSSSSLILVTCIVSRTILFWRVIRTIHCSWDGLQSFLPFAISAYDVLETRPTLLPRSGHDTSGRPSGGSLGLSLYTLVALAWGIATTDTLFLTERRTGTICPPGIPERLIPLAQLLMLLCDALMLIHVGRLRRGQEGKGNSWHTLGCLITSAAAVLAFLAFWSCFDRTNFRWNVFLTSVSVGDLVLDSVAVALALTAGIYLLGTVDAATVALMVTASAVFVHLQLRIFDGTLIKAWSNLWGLGTGLFVFLGVGALLQRARHTGNFASPGPDLPFYKNRFGAYSLLAFALVISQTLMLGPGRVHSDSIAKVIAKARGESDQWISGAMQSKNLNEAALEYTQRYGIPPPPNFDKWYEYAVSVNSPIIDDFAQIHTDLLPYWGISPALIRERTVHLLEHPLLSFGGLIIEGGKVEISPHIRGTHRWMMEVMQGMIEPFAQWLPDMQLAFNLDDECRVSVPFERLNAYRNTGLKARAHVASGVEFHGFSPSQTPPWPKEYLAPLDEEADKPKKDELWKKTSPWFQNWSKSPIFYEWISSACPPDAPVNSFHWWNRKAECPSCSAPHMTDSVVSNWTLSGDLCHQPDLAYLHGFLSSPSAMSATHTLFPVFSQSRMHNFADILYPNPWNFGDKVAYDDGKAIPWHQKMNSVYWRGASSDGFAAHGAWQTFLRARFVYMAEHLKSFFGTASLMSFVSDKHVAQTPSIHASDDTPVAVNVSFVGKFGRCDERDCIAEHTTFYGSPTAEPSPSLDFQEHWRHRHLIDLDGAAFSGRFLPFLKSASLPYRAALFRTWWEERVHPWRHFVPLDVRLSDIWTVVSYFGGKGGGDAEMIAKQGREWANKALRKEDMRAYMFRLLLEWGRLVDDRRDELGFVST